MCDGAGGDGGGWNGWDVVMGRQGGMAAVFVFVVCVIGVICLWWIGEVVVA